MQANSRNGDEIAYPLRCAAIVASYNEDRNHC